jgi:phage-related protein
MALGFFGKLFRGIKNMGTKVYNSVVKPVYNTLAPAVKSLAPVIGGIVGSVVPGVGTAAGGAIGGTIGGIMPSKLS